MHHNEKKDSIRKLRVLISAYSCVPGQGSEPGVGWNVVREISRVHDVWVITATHNQPAIEAVLSQHPNPNLHFIYYDLPEIFRRNRIGVQLHYIIWQYCALAMAKQLYKELRFDVVHHVTYCRYWSPSFLAFLPAPFLWGPVGGGESTPSAFRSTFGLRGWLYECVRDLTRWIGEHLPSVRLTARRSCVALATTRETAERLKVLGAQEVHITTQVGLSEEDIDRLVRIPIRQDPPTRFISIGRLLHLKGFHLGLEAFGRAGLPDAEYWVIGDGPERSSLERLVKKLGIDHQVRFLGVLSRVQVLDCLAECDVLVHPSLHDSGGWVLAEAMVAGRPVICLDIGGPGILVTDEVGIKVEAKDPSQALRDLSHAMKILAEDFELRAKLGTAARQYAATALTWRTKGCFLLDLYSRMYARC